MEKNLLQDYFEEYLKLYPSFASFLGDRSKDGVWENTLDRSHNIKYGRLMKKYDKLVDKVPSRNIDMQILRWIIRDNNEGMKHPTDLLPISSFENPIIDFTFLNKTMYPLETEGDCEHLLSRSRRFADWMVNAVQKMKSGIKRRVVLPRMICQKVIDNLDKFYKNEDFIIKIPPHLVKNKDDVTDRYYNFMRSEYKKSLKSLIDFLKREYLPACRDTVGLCGMPYGKNMYKYLVRSLTTLDDITPQYIHDLGLREVSRLSREIHDVKVKLGYPKDMCLEDFYVSMLTKKTNFFSSMNELMQTYTDMQKYINNNIVKKYFKVDVEDYDIIKVPVNMQESSAGAFFYPGTALSKERKGTFYINTRDLRENPKYAVMALSLHEGKPGHHYQFQYMVEKGVPLHKIYAVNGTAFVEGWALYVESLGEYKNDPYHYFGKLTYEMFRAVRLVVDTGIHAFGWSFKDAVSYMVKHVALSGTEIETEVERYICNPAQALCYKIGEQKLLSLKHRFLKKVDDVKRFHEFVLEDGVLPLSLLERKVKKACK
jgi:uncharacterized protein (DUF885 family)